jgi:hypothetical protein
MDLRRTFHLLLGFTICCCILLDPLFGLVRPAKTRISRLSTEDRELADEYLGILKRMSVYADSIEVVLATKGQELRNQGFPPSSVGSLAIDSASERFGLDRMWEYHVLRQRLDCQRPEYQAVKGRLKVRPKINSEVRFILACFLCTIPLTALYIRFVIYDTEDQ